MIAAERTELRPALAGISMAFGGDCGLCSLSETKSPLDIGHFSFFFCWKKEDQPGKAKPTIVVEIILQKIINLKYSPDIH